MVLNVSQNCLKIASKSPQNCTVDTKESYVSLHVVEGSFAHNVIPTGELQPPFVIRGDVTENDGLVGSTRSDLH